MAKILRVDLSNGETGFEEISSDCKALGGRGLTSKIIYDEVPPECDPLGLENKLVFAPGIMAGTVFPNNGHLSIGSKSPLTETIKESNMWWDRWTISCKNRHKSVDYRGGF